MRIAIHPSIEDIDAAQWDEMVQHHPFQRYDFLKALEDSACIGGQTGWYPAYLVATEADRLVGCCTAFIKTHSMGEYVYDFQFARVAQARGIGYYPKLVVCAPFSPVGGSKIHGESVAVRRAMIAHLPEIGEALGCHGVHALFVDPQEAAWLQESGAFLRTSYQYHWENKQGVSDFEAYLQHMKSKRRKEIHRELRAVEEEGIQMRVRTGHELELEDAALMARFYEHTHTEYGWRGYLNRAFFEAVVTTMSDQLVFFEAVRDGRVVGGAVCWRDSDCLYGRYWGSRLHVPQLHFSCTMYEPIRWCLEHGCVRMESGAGGQHKLRRGFLPQKVYSCHWHFDASFHAALADFCKREAVIIDAEIQSMLETSSPFKHHPEGSRE